MRTQRASLVTFPSGNAAMIVVSHRELDVPGVLRSLAVRDFERLSERWQDEASGLALAGNPERAHLVETYAGVAHNTADAIRGGANFRKVGR